MKKISKVLLTSFLLTNIFVVSANAEETGQTIYHYGDGTSGTTPPTSTQSAVAGFAVVDNAGVVQGVIACSVAFCPTVLEGTYMGCTNCKLVQQTPASPDGNAVGRFSTPNLPVTYNEQTQLFTVGSVNSPEPVTKVLTLDSATLSTTINSDMFTFSVTEPISPIVTPTTSATLSAVEGSQTEVVFFDQPKTRTQLQRAVENKLILISRYLNRFYTLLDRWLIE